jgi:hypothetical protein
MPQQLRLYATKDTKQPSKESLFAALPFTAEITRPPKASTIKSKKFIQQ